MYNFDFNPHDLHRVYYSSKDNTAHICFVTNSYKVVKVDDKEKFFEAMREYTMKKRIGFEVLDYEEYKHD